MKYLLQSRINVQQKSNVFQTSPRWPHWQNSTHTQYSTVWHSRQLSPHHSPGRKLSRHSASCQDIQPAVKISCQLTRYPASCQDILPAVKISYQLSKYPTSCQDILPAVKISYQLSRHPTSCQDILPAVKISWKLSRYPVAAVKICCQLSRYPASCEVHVACWRLLQARRAGSPPGGGGGQRRWGAGAAGGVHAPPPHPTPRNSSESVVKTFPWSWILLFRKLQYRTCTTVQCVLDRHFYIKRSFWVRSRKKLRTELRNIPTLN